ncbi:MAG: hypothetical protein JXA89_11805 [Anaerolineae bacterium]|nr:hypothetical protein [Anaerolineae bacterium]
MSETSLLRNAKAAIDRGDKAAARRLLHHVTANYPNSETAWLLLSTMAETQEQEREYLNQVLALDPQNKAVLERLLKLKQPAQSTLPVEKPSTIEKELVIYGTSAVRATLSYLIIAFSLWVILELSWLLAQTAINPTDNTSGWWLLWGTLTGGPDHMLIILTSAFLAAHLTCALFLAEISAKLTRR